MKRKIKVLLTATLLAVMTVSVFAAIGCAGNKGTLTVDYPENLVFEYGEDCAVPEGVVKDGEKVINAEIKYTFTAPSGKVTEGIYPAIFCNEVGEWEVKYEYGSVSQVKKFQVKDTIAPELSLGHSPFDVFADGETEYSLPEDSFSDRSEIDYDNITKTLTLNGETVKFNALTNRFVATEPGVFNYRMEVKDIYGNSTVEEATWNSKEVGWKDTALPENYLASYDDAGYINTVESGDISAYWIGMPFEEYLEEYEGATGVVKVTTPPVAPYNCAAIRFNLQKTLSEADLIGKNVVIKFLTTTNVTEMRFGSIMQLSDEVGASQNYPVSVTPNEWNYLVLDYDYIKSCNYFDPTQEGFNAFQLGFGLVNNAMSEDCVIYIDSVTVAEKLDKPENLVIKDGTLTWNAVDSATGYIVSENGVETSVTGNSYKIKEEGATLTVRATAGESIFFVQSDKAVYFDPNSFEGGYLATFDSKNYEEILSKSTTEGGVRAAASIKAEYLESFAGETGVLKVTTVTNANTIGDIVLNLPKPCVNGLTVKLMVEKTDCTHIRFLIPGTQSGLGAPATDIKSPEIGVTENPEGWVMRYLNYADSPDIKDRLEIMIQGASIGSENVFYFAFIQEGNTIVENAKKVTAAALTGDYLADFGMEEYEQLVSVSTNVNRVANSITAEWLSEYEGEKGVLKVTTKNNAVFGTTGIGDIVLHLPKACNSGMKIKIMVGEETVSPTIRFLIPGTESGLGAPATDLKSAEINVTENPKGWQERTLNYAVESPAVKDRIEIMLQGGEANGVNVLYFAFVTEA